MIRALRASDSRFRSVKFREGLNVVLADSTAKSAETDTRNGVGKSLLIETVQFCLGGSAQKKDGVVREELSGWSFSLDLELAGKELSVTRNVGAPTYVDVVGDFAGWPIQPTLDPESGAFQLKVDDWTRVLGHYMFDLDSIPVERSYRPTFRMVFPYFARVGRGAYSSPFQYFEGQREWQKQVAITFLLDLAWEQAASWQELKDRKSSLESLRKALKSGALGEALPSAGQLRARRVALGGQVDRLQKQLTDFRVHPEYSAIADEANRLTEQIHEHINANVVRKGQIALYRERLDSETPPQQSDLEQLFEQAGVELGSAVKRSLEEAAEFHRSVVANRQEYLADEMAALQRAVKDANQDIEQLSDRRAERMTILESHHALEELQALQQRLAEMRSELAKLDAQLAQLEEISEGKSRIAIENEEMMQSARRELADREDVWRNCVERFARNTETLYGTPGELIIEIKSSGFKFDVDIPRSGSLGVNKMKVFAFDLMLIQRWIAESRGPGFLVHDSEVFDGVDERQVAAALRLADTESESHGFQYICTLNSDDLPSDSHLQGLEIDPVLRLTDSEPDGALFGFRWD